MCFMSAGLGGSSANLVPDFERRLFRGSNPCKRIELDFI